MGGLFALESPCRDAKKVNVWPVPYQGTVSFMAGTREGPEAIIRASREIEVYDFELDVNLDELCAISMLPEFPCSAAGPEAQCADMGNYLRKFDPGKEFFLLLGGEHTLAYPMLEFYARKYPHLVVLQIDAHADLRPEYQGSRFSHACVMARIRELGLSVAQLGIRSLCREEGEYIRRYAGNGLYTCFASDMPSPSRAAKRIKEMAGSGPVYITFDADGMDPSVIPGTGTPEPGGLDFHWIDSFLRYLWPGPRLVGMDFCELAPLATDRVSESAAAKLILKILTRCFGHERE
ncbi:MAG: agmatinase [Desulfonatronovibrionaceae bacterium]